MVGEFPAQTHGGTALVAGQAEAAARLSGRTGPQQHRGPASGKSRRPRESPQFTDRVDGDQAVVPDGESVQRVVLLRAGYPDPPAGHSPGQCLDQFGGTGDVDADAEGGSRSDEAVGLVGLLGEQDVGGDTGLGEHPAEFSDVLLEDLGQHGVQR